MDWDILFLIPAAWASPVLYPVLVSIAMLAAAGVILWRTKTNHAVRLGGCGWAALLTGCGIIVVSFCVGGLHATQPDYASYFWWPLFTVGYVLAIGAFGQAVWRDPSSHDMTDRMGGRCGDSRRG